MRFTQSTVLNYLTVAEFIVQEEKNEFSRLQLTQDYACNNYKTGRVVRVGFKVLTRISFG